MNSNLKMKENKAPTGLPGGFFIYNAEGDGEILYAEQNVVELFGCKDTILVSRRACLTPESTP